MRRLIPDPGPATVPEQVIQLDLISSAPEDRPYLVTNFAETVDGKATLHGRSGQIGSDTDTEMLVCLRTRVDAVMIGAGTMRAEGYGRVIADPAKREQMGARGQELRRAKYSIDATLQRLTELYERTAREAGINA